MNKNGLILGFAVLLVLVPNVCGAVKLAGIFSDHMVLQRNQPIQIWGWAEPGDNVKVTFGDRTAATLAGDGGSWSVTFEPVPATAHGQSLRVESGHGSIIVRDVVVGEVWHASGQSNMAMNVRAMVGEIERVETDIKEANLPALRYCRIDEPQSTLPLDDLRRQASWVVSTPATVSSWSAVTFYFARRLHAELAVPIGVIDTSRGGTPIEPFIPRGAFDMHPTLRRELELGDRLDLDAIWKLPGGVRARDENWLPARLFHSRVAPLHRVAVRGVIWYQGESNCGDGEDPRDYQHKMRALIRGWREALGNDKLPVYFVQLPGSGAGDGWPYLREQQRLATDLPFTGMVVTVDIEGDGIHPANKIDVAHRLARWALAKDYGKRIAFSGPLFAQQKVQNDQIVIRFKHAGSGLMVGTKNGLAPAQETPDAELAHFEVTDESGNWQSALANIDGTTVVVASPQVKSPIAVRYAYAVSPANCNLYNRDGLPAAPFCSRPELLTYDPQLPE